MNNYDGSRLDRALQFEDRMDQRSRFEVPTDAECRKSLEREMNTTAELPKDATHPNQDAIDGLRKLIDFLVAHPQSLGGGLTLNLYAESKKHLLDSINGVGRVEKTAAGDWFWFSKDFGGDVKVEWNIRREHICERVVTTTLIPAEPEKIVPAQPERVEEIVEWVCPESVLRSNT